MIARIWHGWTNIENEAKYEKLLRTEVIPSIEEKKIKGFRRISLIKRNIEDEVEFITIMIFDNIDAVKELAGEDYENSYVPLKARQVLSRFDQKAQHYQIIDEINYEI